MGWFSKNNNEQAQPKNEAWIVDSISAQSQRKQRQEKAARIVEIAPVCGSCSSVHVQHGHCFSCGHDNL